MIYWVIGLMIILTATISLWKILWKKEEWKLGLAIIISIAVYVLWIIGGIILWISQVAGYEYNDLIKLFISFVLDTSKVSTFESLFSNIIKLL